jgi:hypothetical protein
VRHEVGPDAEVEPLPVQLGGQCLVEAQDIAERGLGLVEQARRERTGGAYGGDARQRGRGPLVGEDGERVVGDEGVLVRQAREGAKSPDHSRIVGRLVGEHEPRRDTEREPEPPGDRLGGVRRVHVVPATGSEVEADRAEELVPTGRRQLVEAADERAALVAQGAFELVEVGNVVEDLLPRGKVGVVEHGVDLDELGAKPTLKVGHGGHVAMVASRPGHGQSHPAAG